MRDLAYLLTDTPGTRILPKGDGRVEIPRSIAFLLGWNRKKRVKVFGQQGRLYLCSTDRIGDGRSAELLGHVSVSMQRVRIPLSFLRKVGLQRCAVIVSSEVSTLDESVVVVQRSCRHRTQLLQSWLDDTQADTNQLQSILFDDEDNVQTVAVQPPKTASKQKWVPRSVPKQVTEAQLFVPTKDQPTVLRVLGRPYVFKGCWVRPKASSQRFRIGLAGDKGTQTFSLIPILRKKGEKWHPGWLLGRDLLTNRIGKIVSSKLAEGIQSEDYDIIIWFDPAQYDWFNVFVNPPAPLPQETLDHGLTACSDIDWSIKRFFKSIDPENLSEGARLYLAPWAITEANFTQ